MTERELQARIDGLLTDAGELEVVTSKEVGLRHGIPLDDEYANKLVMVAHRVLRVHQLSYRPEPAAPLRPVA